MCKVHPRYKVIRKELLMCKVHPKYKAIRKPRAACEACWRMWILKQDAGHVQQYERIEYEDGTVMVRGRRGWRKLGEYDG